MQHEKVFIDTNVLLSPHFDFSKYKKVYTAITCIEELDGLKHDEKVGYQARQAIKNIIMGKEERRFIPNLKKVVDSMP